MYVFVSKCLYFMLIDNTEHHCSPEEFTWRNVFSVYLCRGEECTV